MAIKLIKACKELNIGMATLTAWCEKNGHAIESDPNVRIDDDLYLLGTYSKQPTCLNHFESFVHKSCRVDGYLCSHIPCGVGKCIVLGHMLYLFLRKTTEGATRTSEEYLVDFIAGFETLKYSRMFRIHRQNRYFIFVCQLCDEVTGYDKCFLVGKCYGLLCLYGCNGGFESCKSDHAGKYNIHVVILHHFTQCLGSGINLDGEVAQCVPNHVVFFFVGNDHYFGFQSACLTDYEFCIVVCCQHVSLV